MVLPELHLFFSAAGSLGSDLGLRMDLPEGQVAIGKAYLVSIFGQQLFQNRLDLATIRTLVVGELNDHDRGFRISTQAIWVVADLNLGGTEQNGHGSIGAQPFQIILPELLHFRFP